MNTLQSIHVPLQQKFICVKNIDTLSWMWKTELRGHISNNLDNPQFLLEKELSFLHLLKSLNLYEG